MEINFARPRANFKENTINNRCLAKRAEENWIVHGSL